MAIPNSKSVWKKVFGKNWVSGWFVPYHLFHYDKASLSKLARQHGFDMLESWSRTPESWFRLNVKAWLYPNEMRLDERPSVVDSKALCSACSFAWLANHQCVGNMPRPASSTGAHHTIDLQPPQFFGLRQPLRPFLFGNWLCVQGVRHGLPFVIGM